MTRRRTETSWGGTHPTWRSWAALGALLLGACGAQCFDCRDAACPCEAGKVCKLTDVLPTSSLPGAMHDSAYRCQEERK